MKKVLKIAGAVVLFGIIMLVALLSLLAKSPAIAEDYYKKTTAVGELEKKYQNPGSHDVSYIEKAVLEDFKKYEIWYPSDIADIGKCPLVIFSNGTGVIASKYQAQFKHLASWGFVVIGTEEENSWNGFSSEMCLRFMIKCNENKTMDGWDENPLFGLIDLDKIGVTGHSQGGVGVFSAVTEQKHGNMIQSVFSASPTNIELAHALEWDYDVTKVNVPVMLVSTTGDGDVKLVVSQEQLNDIYTALPEDILKIKAVRNNADHGTCLTETDAYMTAWFLMTLCDDETASRVFLGEVPEIFNNTLYENVEMNRRDMKR